MTTEQSTEQRALAYALAVVMSEISERCWCAGWMQGLGRDLWQAVTVGGMRYGQDSVTAEEAATLKVLAALAGGWWVEYEEWLPLDEVEAYFARGAGPEEG